MGRVKIIKRYILDARTVTPHFPGIGRYVRNLAQTLPDYLQEDEELILIVGDSWQPNDLPFVYSPVSPFSATQQWAIPSILDQIDATVYHSPYYLMPYRLNVPTLLTLYDFIPLIYPQYVSLQARILFRWMTKMALSAATHVTTISHATARDLQRFYHYPERQMTTIHLAADPVFVPQSAENRLPIAQQYQLPDQYALYIGSNKPHKNLARLIEAWARCQPTPFPLVIGGVWLEAHGEIQTEVARLGLAEQVHFIGRIPDDHLPALYSGATFFVFPSEYEGFGLPPLEAMACGTPVITSNVSSLPEVVGSAAILVDPHKIDQLANAMSLLVTQPQLRAELRRKGFAQSQRFSWENSAEATLALYRQCSSVASLYRN